MEFESFVPISNYFFKFMQVIFSVMTYSLEHVWVKDIMPGSYHVRAQYVITRGISIRLIFIRSPRLRFAQKLSTSQEKSPGWNLNLVHINTWLLRTLSWLFHVFLAAILLFSDSWFLISDLSFPSVQFLVIHFHYSELRDFNGGKDVSWDAKHEFKNVFKTVPDS